MRTIYYGFVISVGLYLLIGFTLFLITRGFPVETLKRIAFGLAIMLLISAFPLYKTLYHGSKGANPTYTAYTPPRSKRVEEEFFLKEKKGEEI